MKLKINESSYTTNDWSQRIMKLKINEDENTYEKFKDKYILFNRGNETEFDNKVKI